MKISRNSSKFMKKRQNSQNSRLNAMQKCQNIKTVIFMIFRVLSEMSKSHVFPRLFSIKNMKNTPNPWANHLCFRKCSKTRDFRVFQCLSVFVSVIPCPKLVSGQSECQKPENSWNSWKSQVLRHRTRSVIREWHVWLDCDLIWKCLCQNGSKRLKVQTVKKALGNL